jgi:hypothetical protein
MLFRQLNTAEHSCICIYCFVSGVFISENLKKGSPEICSAIDQPPGPVVKPEKGEYGPKTVLSLGQHKRIMPQSITLLREYP